MSLDELAERVRARCLETARDAYEDAGIQGLCAEGRWEAALGAVERLDLRALVAALAESAPPPRRDCQNVQETPRTRPS